MCQDNVSALEFSVKLKSFPETKLNISSNCSFIDNPSKEQLDDMLNLVSGKLFSLTENTRAETLSWHTYIRYLNIAKKKKFNYLSYYLFITFCYYISIRVLQFIIIIMPYYIINLWSFCHQQKTLKKLFLNFCDSKIVILNINLFSIYRGTIVFIRT